MDLKSRALISICCIMEVCVLRVHSLEAAFCRHNQTIPIFQDVTLHVGHGEFVSILGHSGCGKSTLLLCLAGLFPPSSGTVYLKGQLLTKPAPEMVMVFQDYVNSLFPWKTAVENVLFALPRTGLTKPERVAIAMDHLAAVGLLDYASYHPWELSGGMQQRLTIARALAQGAEMLLMDEPFASLDAQTRYELEDLLLQIHTSRHKTIIFVTHDIEEALYLSHRVVLMADRPSRIVAELPVPLPSPRNQLTTRALPEFLELRAQVYTMLFAESV